MDPVLAVLAATVGYLLGSVSFARVVANLVAPQLDISSGVELNIPGAKESLQLDGIGGTAVAAKLGDRYGCLAGMLDMLKVAAPTLAFKLAYPGATHFLITAGMGGSGPQLAPVLPLQWGGETFRQSMAGSWLLTLLAPWPPAFPL